MSVVENIVAAASTLLVASILFVVMPAAEWLSERRTEASQKRFEKEYLAKGYSPQMASFLAWSATWWDNQ